MNRKTYIKPVIKTRAIDPQPLMSASTEGANVIYYETKTTAPQLIKKSNEDEKSYGQEFNSSSVWD